jgi:hypothetical protein
MTAANGAYQECVVIHKFTMWVKVLMIGVPLAVTVISGLFATGYLIAPAKTSDVEAVVKDVAQLKTDLVTVKVAVDNMQTTVITVDRSLAVLTETLAWIKADMERRNTSQAIVVPDPAKPVVKKAASVPKPKQPSPPSWSLFSKQ